MKKFNTKYTIKYILYTLCAALIVTAVIFLIPKNNGAFNLESLKGYLTAKHYFSEICNGNLEKASKYVRYYTKTPGTPAQEDFSDKWVNRVQALKDNDFPYYLVAYDCLDVHMDGGFLVGTVRIDTILRGVEKTYVTDIIFQNGKIADMTAENIKTELESALSGNTDK